MQNLTGGNEMKLEFTKNTQNTYYFLDVQAPEGFVVSIFFQQMEIDGARDDKAFLLFGDNATDFQGKVNSCDTWISLTNKEGQLENRHKKFASRSPSVKLIFSSLSAEVNLIVKIRAVQLQSNQHLIILFIVHVSMLIVA